jgi:hypothetical protein
MLNPLELLIEHFPDENWNWSSLSRNPLITWRIVRKFPEKPWLWSALSKKLRISWQTVLETPELDWNYSELALNPSITEFEELASSSKTKSQLREFGNIYSYISKNSSLAWEQVRRSPEKHWNIISLFQNPGFEFLQ